MSNFITTLFKLSLLTLLSITLIQNNLADAIKCYVCQSNVDPKCADPFDNLTLPITDCDAYPRADLVPRSEFDIIEEKGFFSAFSQPAPVKPLAASMCRKVRQKVNGEWRTIRGCGYLGPPGDQPADKQDNSNGNCQMRHGSYDVFMESCTCNNKDGCNGAQGKFEPDRNAMYLIITTMFMQIILRHGRRNLIQVA